MVQIDQPTLLSLLSLVEKPNPQCYVHTHSFWCSCLSPFSLSRVYHQPRTKKWGASGRGRSAENKPHAAAALVPGCPGKDCWVRKGPGGRRTTQCNSAEGDGAIVWHIWRAEQWGQEDRVYRQELLRKNKYVNCVWWYEKYSTAKDKRHKNG